MKTYIPTIHVDNDDHIATVAAVRKACLESGFFYVTGHGIETSNVMEQSKKFFQLPIHEKKAVSDSTLTRGYTAMQEETLDPSKQKIGDTKEGFYINILDIPTNDPRYNPSKLAGPNQWPTPINCPSMNDHETFKTTMLEYMDKVMTLTLTISSLIAESLGLPANYFDSSLAHEPMATLRLLHYDTTISNIDTGIYACGAHSDYGMITILLTDENDGLQIYDQRGCQEWINVPTIPDCFVVNLGDMLQQWTNGMYCSTLHRVINTSGKERYSIPFFSGPNFDTIVQCLDVCCTKDNPAKYLPTTSGEYLLSKYRQTHADFTPV
jgi:isopenicillin N synthase-like dioxygenase